MAKAAAVKIPPDIEFRVLSNAFGLFIAAVGLLGGNMVTRLTFSCWRDDIVPLIFILWIGFRLYRNVLSLLAHPPAALPEAPQEEHQPAAPVTPEQVITAQISPPPSPTAEQVVEEITRRIEAKKKAAEKNNKFTN